MYPPRPTLLVSLLLLFLGVSFGKKCPIPKELKLMQNMKVTLNSSNIAFISTVQDDIRLHSLSPWSYRLDEDENRYPAVIAEAVCSHHNWCLDSEGKKDHKRKSIPITHNTLVLRREVTNCHHNFRLEYQLVTVGCTCSEPNVRVVS